MVSYSYKKMFAPRIALGLGLDLNPDELPWLRGLPIAAGVELKPKRQTIRADRKRHARVGEELQHYCGMRTKNCFLIGRARCTEVRDIVLTFGKFSAVSIGGTTNSDGSWQRETHYAGNGLDEFATMDGFGSWRDMVTFWQDNHGSLSVFTGVLIEWEPLR